MLYIRPGRLSDLDQIERMAAVTRPMLHSLPADRELLREKLARSQASFAAEVLVPGEESYCLVLEDSGSGRLLGTAMMIASAGFPEPFSVYRKEVIIHASRPLNIYNRIHALTLSHELTGDSQLSGFFVDAALGASEYPQLLSRARLIFMAEHPQRFSENLFSVLPGVSDEKGISPFWENVGRKFFGLEFSQADFLSGGRSKTFIAELMPHHPIYVPLLGQAAQAVLGQAHPRSRVPFAILADEGFAAGRFVDIFDAGPVMTARRALCRSVSESVRRRVAIDSRPAHAAGVAQAGGLRAYLVCNALVQDFRCALLRLPDDLPENVVLDATTAQLLEVETGGEIRCAALHHRP